jgi:membrane-bound serine protease (ClpP class)
MQQKLIRIIMKKKIFLVTLFIISITTFIQAKNDSIQSDTAKKIIYVFDIDKEIAPAIWRQTQKSFDEAIKLNSDYIIIRINTYGGMVNMADSIRTKILESSIPVFAFIENNAASAGALISIAADSIYMKKGAKIGSASVVDQTGKIMPEKYQSYMRSTMRATAEAHGADTIITQNDTIIKWKRDPLIAEAMVDPRVIVEGLSDTSTIVAFTAQEALKYGYCEAIVNDVEDILKHAGIDNYEIKSYDPSGMERFIGFLLNPIVQGILIMLMVGGIYFELQTPGIGFPLGAAAFAAVFYFAPLYLEGIAENWELIIFILGLVLIAIEIFAIPGFGVIGIAGILLAISGLVLSMIDNIIFDFEFHADEAYSAVVRSLVIVASSFLASLVLSIYFSKKMATTSILSGIVLNSEQKRENGFIGVDYTQRNLIGKTGITSTWLRPSGKIEIDNQIYDAISEIGFIEVGQKVKVVDYRASQLYVVKA